METDLYNSIIEIANDDDPYVDHYGRCSFFKVKIADEEIPILQPGTIAFESAVKENSSIACMYKDAQRNGVVFLSENSIFLAKFITKLAKRYEAKAIGIDRS